MGQSREPYLILTQLGQGLANRTSGAEEVGQRGSFLAFTAGGWSSLWRGAKKVGTWAAGHSKPEVHPDIEDCPEQWAEGKEPTRAYASSRATQKSPGGFGDFKALVVVLVDMSVGFRCFLPLADMAMLQACLSS